jgi:drug/metabolite transporter (DMT)-like permease
LVRPSAGGDVVGALALVLASFSWSCGSIYARHAGIRADPITVTAWEMFFGGLMFLAIGTVTGGVFTARFDGAGLGAILYLVVAGSWIGFTAYVWLLANVPAAKAATYAYVNPVIAPLLGWWLSTSRSRPRSSPARPSCRGGGARHVGPYRSPHPHRSAP